MSNRQTRGRQRIPIRLIENQDDLYATFSKRRHGVYKKASELGTLCGVDIGIIIFSPSNNPFSFFSPSMESVVNKYMNPNHEPSAFARMAEHHTRARIQDLNRRLDEMQERKEELKLRERHLDEIDRTREKGWWEQVPIESLNKEQVQEWKAWFENLRSRVTNRIEELKNGGSSSSVFQQQNAPNFPHAPTADTPYGPTSQTIVAGQFPSQYYVPQTMEYPSFQYHVSSQIRSPFVVGSSTGHVPIQYNYFPPQGQNQSASGRTGGGGPSNINP